MNKFQALLCITAVVALPAGAQVYKCKGPGGVTVYSQNACGSDSKELNVRGTRAATTTAAEEANRQTVYKSTDLSEAGIKERNCLAAADDRIYAPMRSRVSGYERQIGALNQELATANNNLAGATYATGIRGQIASLNQSIATERSNADTQMSNSRQQCAEARRREEEAIQRKYDAPRP